ncbi:MAG: hypothetical protein ABI769_01855 [Pseudomonadota bacterium]
MRFAVRDAHPPCGYLRVLTLLVALSFAPAFARADTYCSGVLNEYLVYADGSLMIRGAWRQGWTYLCNVQGTWKGIPAEACFSWLAIVGSSKAHAKPLGVYYSGDLNCAALAEYSASPAPVYVRMGE